jgi:hypothetical protein
MKHALALTLALSIPAALTHPAHAQWCGEDCVNFQLDAQLGLESLEEPTAGSTTPKANGYATVNAAGLFQLYNFQTVIQAPLRFDINDFGIRKQDWDSTGEWLRVFRCARVDFMQVADPDTGEWHPVRNDEPGDCLSWTPTESVGDVFREGYDFTYYSLRLDPITNFSLGYGSIVDGYNAMLEQDFYRAGLTAELNLNRALVVTAALSDVADPTVAAARAAVRPINTSTPGDYGTEPGRELYLEIGTTAAADFQAPTLRSGHREEQGLAIGGVDARFRWSSVNDYTRESYRIIRFELGTEYNQIFRRSGGLHTHLRFYYDIGPVDLYVDGEYRLVNGQYFPAYFDQHYRVQREQYLLSDDQRREIGAGDGLRLTKLDFLDALPDTVEQAYAANLRLRFWPWSAEQSAWTQDGADFWLFVEDVPARSLSGRAGAGLVLYNVANKLRVWSEFVQQGWDDLSGLFTLKNSVLDIQGRYSLTDQIYLDLYFDQTWFLLDTGAFDTTNDVGLSVGFNQGG